MQCLLRILLVVIVLFTFFHVSTLNATQDGTPPANWTSIYYKENINTSDWDIIYPTSTLDDSTYFFNGEEYCIGIIKYTTKASVTDPISGPQNPTEGWAYGYWATLKTEDITNCYYLVEPPEQLPHKNRDSGAVEKVKTLSFFLDRLTGI